MNTGPTDSSDQDGVAAQSAIPDSPVADYRQYYGLSEDPFRNDPEFAFFGGGGRRALLEQLQHLCQFSASLLAVLGKPGVGKSRVALELANSFQFDDEICLLAAEPGAGAEAVLGQMARHFALSVDENPSVGRLLAALRHFAQVADEEDRLALTIIDDAHHLDEKTLGALISLLQGQDSTGRRLHIVLFADSEMVSRLDQFNMHDVLIHDFELSPFSLEEATDYLNFRMEMADYMGPELFTEEKVEPWWRRAEGRLPRLHEQARRWLLESVSARASSGMPGTRRNALPLVHIVVIAVLLGVLLMVFIYQGDSETAERESTTRLPESRETQTLTLSSNNEASNRTGPEPSAETTQTPTPVTPERAQPELLSPEPSVEERPETPQPDEASEPEEVSAPAAQAETPAEQPPSEESTVAQASSLPDIPEDEQVLLSWRASEYTLQLLGASSRASVDRYIEAQPNREQLLSFETRRQGKPWFVVVTGRYSGTESAREAIRDLPEEQRKAGPWPRVMSDIHEEIKESRGL
ncbi:AAA family ATPase [Marinimicrobium sp. C6131]|uniref:SPOR domain-containing protein n=1 Tax=Marinimicrobium sp. C6131 TaxID=3022676 RepID=UPI00223CEFB2|nr:AAA family ATPase [Marinimicrobium sp. C6131]UZJ43255.1 AAA family ATPase [Marinimicrobium sp. C6131]